MKTRTFLLLATLIVSTSAFATGSGKQKPPQERTETPIIEVVLDWFK